MTTARDGGRPRGDRTTARVPGGLRQAMPLVAWLASLGVAIVAFTAMGSGPLAAPPVTEPGAWGQWAAARQPVVATVAVLRLVVLALAWYLVGVTTVGAVARLARMASLVRLADTLSIPVVRRVLQTSLGVGLATAVVTASAPGVVTPHPAAPAPAAAAAGAEEADDDRAVPGMQPLDDTSPTMQALDEVPGDGAPRMQALDEAPDGGGEPAMQPLAGADPAPPGMRPLAPAGESPADAATSPPVTPVDARQPTGDQAVADTWTVASGDHLWAIAETHLQDTLGSAPSDEVVAAYWERLVEANRGRLVDPDDPDLIVPGQRFVLPDVEVSG